MVTTRSARKKTTTRGSSSPRSRSRSRSRSKDPQRSSKREEKQQPRRRRRTTTTTTTTKAQVSGFQAIHHAGENLFINVFKDARNSGLPWDGMQCRSLIAGGTGVLYALPALACPTPAEKSLWFVQATCSVVADYFMIHTKSYWHGVDRIVATLMTFRAIFLVAMALRPWIVVVAAVPLSWFFAGARAKKTHDLEDWKRCHCGWHISGSLIVLVTSAFIDHCGAGGARTAFVRGTMAALPPLASVADAACAAVPS